MWQTHSRPLHVRILGHLHDFGDWRQICPMPPRLHVVRLATLQIRPATRANRAPNPPQVIIMDVLHAPVSLPIHQRVSARI